MKGEIYMTQEVGKHLSETEYNKILYPYSRNEGIDFSIPTLNDLKEYKAGELEKSISDLCNNT